MPSYPIRPNPDKDFYVLWSTVTDSPYGAGSREDIRAIMLDDERREAERMVERSLERADLPRRKTDLIVSEGPGRGLLPAEKLEEYARLWMSGNDEAAAALVTPWPDEEEEE